MQDRLAPHKILVFLLLLLFKQVIFFLGFFSGSILSFAIIVISLFLSPELFLATFIGGNSQMALIPIAYSYIGLVYLYVIAIILCKFIQRRIDLSANKYIKRGRFILWALFFIVLIFPLLILLPSINKSNIYIKNIDYEKLSKPSYHTVSSLPIPSQQMIEQFPEIHLVELWREDNPSSLVPIDRILDMFFSPAGATSMVMPAYRYKVEGNQIILGSDVSCVDIEKSKIIIADGWNNSILPIEQLPGEFENEFISEPVSMLLQSTLPDGSIEISKEGKKIMIPLNQEYSEQVIKTGVISGSDISWGVRNFGLTKVQCYPDFIYDTNEKDSRLFDLAQKERQESYCAQIASSEGKEECYRYLYGEIIKQAVDNKDETVCEQINSQSSLTNFQAKCIKEVASIVKRSDLCLSIPATAITEKHECFGRTSGSDTCNTITDPREKDTCFYGTSYCEFIDDKTLSDSCYLNDLSNIWERIGYEASIKVCEGMGATLVANTAEFNRGVCYQNLAKSVAGKDPYKALTLAEQVKSDHDRQNIMYRLIAEVVAKTNRALAEEICGKITVDTIYASRSSCLTYVNSQSE